MGYDFRKKQAGERDFVTNFERDAQQILDDSRRKIRKAGDKYLKIVDELLGNFDLSLDLKISRVYYYMVHSGGGNEADRYAVRGHLTVKGDLPKDGVEGALWDVTGGVKFHVSPGSAPGTWFAEFDMG